MFLLLLELNIVFVLQSSIFNSLEKVLLSFKMAIFESLTYVLTTACNLQTSFGKNLPTLLCKCDSGSVRVSRWFTNDNPNVYRQWERKKELGLKPISTRPYFKVHFFVLTLQPYSTVSFNTIFFKLTCTESPVSQLSRGKKLNCPIFR